tara:strand:+ start:59 stop:457 length:399 start_codon:yes stop_codon:yes gene_type:complete
MAGIGNYSKGKKFVLKSGNKPAFKMMGSSPMHENTDPKKVKKDAKESHDASVLDSDALMRAKQDVTEKSDRLDRAIDWVKDSGTAKTASGLVEYELDRATDQVEDAKKKVSQATYPSGKPKKGSGKPGSYEY